MPIVEPNFEEFPKIKPGEYLLEIKDCEHKISKNGKPYLNWKLTVERGPNKGFKVYFMTGLVGKGAQAFRSLVNAAGVTDYETGSFNTDDILGKVVKAKLDRQINFDGTEGKYFQIVELSPSNMDDISF